eukprot:scaffold54446_cov17-Prasinocladus_malaysianus.AAC.1
MSDTPRGVAGRTAAKPAGAIRRARPRIDVPRLLPHDAISDEPSAAAGSSLASWLPVLSPEGWFISDVASTGRMRVGGLRVTLSKKFPATRARMLPRKASFGDRDERATGPAMDFMTKQSIE